jgi:hypothetical protein
MVSVAVTSNLQSRLLLDMASFTCSSGSLSGDARWTRKQYTKRHMHPLRLRLPSSWTVATRTMKGTDDVLKLLVETKGMQYNPEKHTIRVPGSSPRIEVVLHLADGRPLSTYVVRGCVHAEDIALVRYGSEDARAQSHARSGRMHHAQRNV